MYVYVYAPSMSADLLHLVIFSRLRRRIVEIVVLQCRVLSERVECRELLLHFGCYLASSFIVNPAFENAKASSKIITTALDLYFKGISLRKISDHLEQFYNFQINCSSVCRWIRKFT